MKTLSPKVIVLIFVFALVTSGIFVLYQIQTVQQSTPALAATTSIDKSIQSLETNYSNDPSNMPAALSLTAAYLQKIRETGDSTYYEKIQKILDSAETHAPDNSVILATRAEVENGRHNFKTGLEYIKQAIIKNSDVSNFYGIESDSEIELGKYDEALVSLQKMIDRKPNFSSFSRVAYQRELHGDRIGATEALSKAISADSTHPENKAWAYTEMGKLLVKEDPEQASRNFKQSLEIYPNFAPALEGLGRVAWSQMKYDEAESYYTQAFAALPLAQYATALGNFYETRDLHTKGNQQYALADLAYKNSKGVNVDLEYSLFLSDHGDKKEALTRAEAAYNERPSIYGADAYAWSLLKNNQLQDAQKYINEALRLGENDSLILFHAGTIAAALGERERSVDYYKKALALDQFAATNYSQSLLNLNI